MESVDVICATHDSDHPYTPQSRVAQTTSKCQAIRHILRSWLFTSDKCPTCCLRLLTILRPGRTLEQRVYMLPRPGL